MKKLFLAVIFFLTVNFCAASDYYERGKIAYDSRQYRKAQMYLEKALIKDYENPLIRFYYGCTLLNLGEIQKAKNEYRKVILMSPGTTYAKLSNLALIEIKNRYSGNLSKEAPIKLAGPQAGDVKITKESQMSSYTKKFPDDPAGWADLARYFRSQGQYKAAIINYKKALLIDINNAQYDNEIAKCYEAAGDFDNALSAYKTAVMLDTDNKNYMLDYAKFAHKLQKGSLAKPYIENFFNNNPDIVEDSIIIQLKKFLQ